MQIKINRNILIALNLIASRDESRYVLNGVCIQVTPATKTKPAKCHVIATDGRRLCAIEDGEVVIPPTEKRDAIVRVNVPMLKALPKSEVCAGDVLITFGEKSAKLEAFESKGVSFESELIEGHYPKWRQVVPKGALPSPLDPCFDCRLLEGFIKAAEMIAGKRSIGVSLRQADALAPILVLMPSLRQMFGVIMPMRGDDVQTSAPDWATEQPEEAPKAEPQVEVKPANVAI